MDKKLNNKWTHGETNFGLPPGGEKLFKQMGIYYLHASLDSKMGEEVLLILYDDTDFIYELKNLKPFRFYVSSLAVNTDFGPVAVFLFNIGNPVNIEKNFAIYDKPINLSNQDELKPWEELGNQSHIHLLLVNIKLEVVGFYEFENTFNLDEAVDFFSQLNPERVIDFDKALEEYFRDYSLEDLNKLTKNKN